ncbi:hypothetical protein H0H81_002172 [Sphagnurus paluster]|uniref:Ectomycorrhiza-regulated esterase n=1 Tax=Sphagnurus paluster TaxID=117069 RepID=A0A9P7K2Q2_9AGAR|nr:hypothetical protein H0H81_002172 [Sphagnurus paluster]
MASPLSTKLYISHTTEPDCSLVGVLEQLSPSSSTKGRKIALILHGTMGHKDYLFQKRLALKLPLDSFRFDFRGNHESGGRWRQGALEDDLVDLSIVVEFLKATYGYVIHLVRILGTTNAYSPVAKVWKASFDDHGYHEWTVSVARKQVTVRIFPEDLEQFINWNASIVKNRFPPTVDVLTVHGLADTIVPPYDAVIYTSILSNRTPGTHTLNFIEDADHNFTGRQDEVVSAILGWWAARERGELQTGVWVETEHNGGPKAKF